MKTVLVLSILLCAAFAAPAEEKAPGAAVEVLKEEVAAAPEMENMMMETEDVKEVLPEDSVPVLGDARNNICPDHWTRQGSRCYVFVSSSLSWYKAKEHCQILGAHLPSATNPSEYAFLQQMTKTAGQSMAWMGGFNVQGTWMWSDGEGFYYDNWYSYSSSSTYSCMYLRSSYGWGNYNCNYAAKFICSKDPFSC